jgi:hypothetical protein
MNIINVALLKAIRVSCSSRLIVASIFTQFYPKIATAVLYTISDFFLRENNAYNIAKR